MRLAGLLGRTLNWLGSRTARHDWQTSAGMACVPGSNKGSAGQAVAGNVAYTRMNDPARAERLWLAIALATWWLLTVGGVSRATSVTRTKPWPTCRTGLQPPRPAMTVWWPSFAVGWTWSWRAFQSPITIGSPLGHGSGLMTLGRLMLEPESPTVREEKPTAVSPLAPRSLSQKRAFNRVGSASRRTIRPAVSVTRDCKKRNRSK